MGSAASNRRWRYVHMHVNERDVRDMAGDADSDSGTPWNDR